MIDENLKQPSIMETDCDESITSLVWHALIYFYFGWLIIYYVWVFLVLGKYIEKKGYKTLYDYVATEGPASLLFKKMKFSPTIKKIIYMLIHLVFGVVTMMIAGIWWSNKAAHILFILSIFTAAAWNAGTFYFNVFTREYETRLQSKYEARLKARMSESVAPSQQ